MRTAVLCWLTLLVPALLAREGARAGSPPGPDSAPDAGAKTSLIQFGTPVTLPATYAGLASSGRSLERRQVAPRALATGDLDEDGVPDLIAGYAGPDGGLLTLHRGNVDALYPNSRAARERRARGMSTSAPFLPSARVTQIPGTPEFLESGDFDADGHLDVVSAARGDRALHWLRGDGKGNLALAPEVVLPGGVTALTAGEIHAADGLTDLVIGTEGPTGPRLLVYQGPEGALRAEPEEMALPAAATSLALGALDDEYPVDLAVAAGPQVLLIRGRDRRQPEDAPLGGKEALTFPAAVAAVAVGDFTDEPEHRTEVAVLTGEGTLHLLARPPGQSGWSPTGGSRVAPRREADRASEPLLLPARVTSGGGEDLLLVERAGGPLRLLRGDRAGRIASVSLAGGDAMAAALPMRLNADALSDLVLVQEGRSAPAVAMTRAARTFVVTNTDDSGPGSLRQAILDANANPGADTINFNIPGGDVPDFAPLTPLPDVTEAVLIDGTTQASGQVHLAPTPESGGGAGLQITGGNSTVRGLAITSGFQAGIRLQTRGGNRIEGCFFTFVVAGVTVQAPDNTVGGTASEARNFISQNTTGVLIENNGSTGNRIQGNYIGTDVAGTAAIANTDGVVIRSSGVATSNNLVGGTASGARNIISGNMQDGVRIAGTLAAGNLVQGNFVGTTPLGTTPLGNSNGVAIDGASNNTVGGTVAGARNLLSGNGQGVYLRAEAQRNVVQGNFIGTNIFGTAALGNIYGVTILGSPNNTVGGTIAAAGNLISGNRFNGIILSGSGARGNLVQGNRIGTNAAGTAALGNAVRGVDIQAPNNTIGGAVAGARNVISGNGESGVLILTSAATGNRVQGNYIGTDAAGSTALGNGLDAVRIDNAPGNVVGGTVAAARNILSGNARAGVYLLGSAARGNLVQGNFIGTNAAGSGALANREDGVVFDNAPNNTVGGTAAGARNLISGNRFTGVHIQGSAASGNKIQGNYIGTNAGGTSRLPNPDGVFIDGAPNNTVGGTLAGARNLISGNVHTGITIGFSGATGNVVQGNYIGTDAGGTAKLGNDVGIAIDDAPNNTIGGTSAAARNLISGNATGGVSIESTGATGNKVQGNFIGTQANGASALGNGAAGGVSIAGASNNTVGGTASGAGNTLAFNSGDGVLVIGDTGNTILGNRIFTNTGLGIDLGPNGVTPNDTGDGDGGANNLQNSPVLATVAPASGSTVITGTLNSTAGASFRLEFFASPTADPTGFGEGMRFLGALMVTTDSAGNARFSASLPVTVASGQQVAATATRLVSSVPRDTSEFSRCRQVP